MAAKETKEVIEFLLSLGEAAGRALSDNDIGLTDAIYFFDAMRRLDDAVKGYDKIPAELLAWTPEDTAEMVAAAKEFDIPQDRVEERIKDAIKIAGPVIEYIAKFKHADA